MHTTTTHSSLKQQGKLIHQTSDEYSNILVFDSQEYRIMSFDSVYEQSSYYREKPYALAHEYTRIMLLALGFIAPKHITLLGLGGGSLLRSLHFYVKHSDFQVVELRPQVFDTAKRFFDIPLDDRVEVVIGDALQQLQKNNNNSTDIIFSDIYDATDMSSIQLQKQFLIECERTLSKQGWLVINFHTLPDKHSAFFKALSQLFNTVLVCASQYKSHILFACKAHTFDFTVASTEILKMEKALSSEFMTLFYRLEKFDI